jgi:hypothetical protein
VELNAEVSNTWNFVSMSSVRTNVKLSLCLTKHHTMKRYWGNGGI